jgi:RimJ/RimL family protein N-acetyltransferase
VDWREVELRMDDVEVRPWRDTDREAIGSSPRDAVIGRYFGRALGGSPVAVRDPDAPVFAICRAGEPVGRIWFRPGIRPFEVGYFVRSDAWGQGVATRALTLVSDWMLHANKAEVIVLCTHPENVGSQRVAAKAGFMRDGIEASYADFKDGTREAICFTRRASET